jgi:hypothetical protein
MKGKDKLKNINVIVLCLFPGNVNLSAKTEESLKELVKNAGKGALIIMNIQVHDTLEKKKSINEMLDQVVETTKVYKS